MGPPDVGKEPLTRGKDTGFSKDDGTPGQVVKAETSGSSSRRVTWREINGACAEVMQFEVADPSASCSLHRVGQQDSQRCSSAICAYFKELWNVIRNTPEEPEERPDLSGYLWKLNADVEDDLDQLANIRNWRRRLFFLRLAQGRLALTYISEKENGMLHLACIFDPDPASVTELPRISVSPITQEALHNLGNNMRQYDLAFVDFSVFDEATYEEQAPQQLFPFKVVWKDQRSTEHSLLLATQSVFHRTTWLRHIEGLQLECGRHRQFLDTGSQPP